MFKLGLFSEKNNEKTNRYNAHIEKLEQCVHAVDALNNAVEQYVKHPSKANQEQKEEYEKQVSESCAHIKSNGFK